MQQGRPKNTFDALGDLFLTNPLNTPSPTSNGKTQGNSASASSPKSCTPPNEKTNLGNDLSDLNAAAAFEANRDDQIEKEAIQISDSVLDLLKPPSLKLVGGTADNTTNLNDVADDNNPPAPNAFAYQMQAVFLGQLPGFGGPWLAQYAHQIAAAQGPVGIIHVGDQQIDIEMVTTLDQHAHATSLRDAFEASNSETSNDHPNSQKSLKANRLIAQLDKLLKNEAYPVNTWLFHLTMPLTDSSVRYAKDFDQWTLLTGTGDASLVGAYQWMKRLQADIAPARVKKQDIGVMLMGCDQLVAKDTANRLNATAANCLGKAVKLIGSRKQMVPVNVDPLGSFTHDKGLWDQLMQLFAGLLPDDNQLQTPAIASFNLVSDTDEADDFNSLATTKPSHTTLVHAPNEMMTVELDLSEGPINLAELLNRELAIQYAENQADSSLSINESNTNDLPNKNLYNNALNDLSSNNSSFINTNNLPTHKLHTNPPTRLDNAPEIDAKSQSPIPALKQSATQMPSWAQAQPPSTTATILEAKVQTHTEAETQTKVAIETKVKKDERRSPSPTLAPSSPAAAVAITDELNLASFITGSIRLTAHCPSDPETQLALDEDGKLHLLRYHQPSSEACSIEQTYLQLLETRHWLNEHLTLLQQTQRQLKFAPDAAPTLHLFTNNAKQAVKLLARHLPKLQCHLLEKIQLGPQATWFCAALNDA